MTKEEFLLDTNHISPLVTIGHPLREIILDHLKTGTQFSIAAPALNEFLFGISTLPRARQNLTEWERLKQDFNISSIDQTDAELVGQTEDKLTSKRVAVGNNRLIYCSCYFAL